VFPRPPQAETLIEYAHRLTSGALLQVVDLVGWAFRAFPKDHQVRHEAALALGFMLLEVLIGAGLVVFGLAAGKDSLAQAAVLALQLANTFVLLAMLVLTAWWASGGQPLKVPGQGVRTWLFALALMGAMSIGMTGAINALGDTLFPTRILVEGLRQSFSPVSHPLLRLRLIHPLVSVALGSYLQYVVSYIVVAWTLVVMPNAYSRSWPDWCCYKCSLSRSTSA
jgi:protoheme IX farnesyltransferase